MNGLTKLFTLLVLLCQLVCTAPAQAYLASEVEAMQSAAKTAVETALAQLEAANQTGDPARVTLAAAVLDLALNNYAAISEYLDRPSMATDTDNIVCTTCQALSAKLTALCAELAAGNLAAARTSLAAAHTLAAAFPENEAAGLPAGLAYLSARIDAAIAAATNVLGGGASGSGDKLLINQPASGI